MKGLSMKYFAILALAPFFILTVKAASTCAAVLAEYGDITDDWIIFLALSEYARDNQEHCELASEEGPSRFYSDAIIMQSWAYCVEKYGGYKTRRYHDWEKLGLTGNEVGDKEGEDLWPYNPSAGRGSRIAKNYAAKRVAEKCGDFSFIRGRSPALIGALEFLHDFQGLVPKKGEAAAAFVEKAGKVGDSEARDKISKLKTGFKERVSNPTRVLSVEELNYTMDQCDVPSHKQNEYRAYAETFFVGNED